MKIIIERTQFEPIYRKGISIEWNVAWTIETDTGLSLYIPSTIARRDMDGRITEATITTKSFQRDIPSQIAMLYKEVDVVSELDEIEAQIEIENRKILEESEHYKKLQEERTKKIEDAKQRLEAKREERRKLAEANIPIPTPTPEPGKSSDKNTTHSH